MGTLAKKSFMHEESKLVCEFDDLAKFLWPSIMHKSIGSMSHAEGRCNPCAFWASGRCGPGILCNHCHDRHTGPKRLSKQRRDRQKAEQQLQTTPNIEPQVLM